MCLKSWQIVLSNSCYARCPSFMNRNTLVLLFIINGYWLLKRCLFVRSRSEVWKRRGECGITGITSRRSSEIVIGRRKTFRSSIWSSGAGWSSRRRRSAVTAGYDYRKETRLPVRVQAQERRQRNQTGRGNFARFFFQSLNPSVNQSILICHVQRTIMIKRAENTYVSSGWTVRLQNAPKQVKPVPECQLFWNLPH